MALMADLYGVRPARSFAETNEGQAEEDFAELAQRIAISKGRELTNSELVRLAELDERGDLTGETELDISEAVYDLDTSDGRSNLIADKLQVVPERIEPSANVIGHDGEERPGFNLDVSSERVEAIDRLLEGQDVTAYDDTLESIKETE